MLVCVVECVFVLSWMCDLFVTNRVMLHESFCVFVVFVRACACVLPCVLPCVFYRVFVCGVCGLLCDEEWFVFVFLSVFVFVCLLMCVCGVFAVYCTMLAELCLSVFCVSVVCVVCCVCICGLLC